MNSLANNLQRGIETQLFKYAREYPLLGWILFYIIGLYVFYISFSILFLDKRFTKNSIHFIFFVIAYLVVLCYFTITKSYGLLIYPCVFTWLSTFFVIYIVYKKDKGRIKSNKNDVFITTPENPNQLNNPNQTNKKKSKNQILRNTKLIDNSKYKIKNNDKNKSESKK